MSRRPEKIVYTPKSSSGTLWSCIASIGCTSKTVALARANGTVEGYLHRAVCREKWEEQHPGFN
jgi:hypothetical protein